MMKRDECLKVLARHRGDEIMVPVYKAAQEWIHISPSDLNYTFTGAMGQGSSHALGLALGRPDKRVIVLDGDGSLLMNLGTLVTIATAAPKNLVHCVCENGTYETNGAVPLPGVGRFSFTAMARAAGYPKTYEFSDLEGWQREVGRILKEEGPILVTLKVEPGELYPEDFRRLYSVERREAFRQALQRG
ncbi:MAG: thiamine pyrophosphate-binding protein [Deltaproteobacteria bacterium]|nr:thiamine pyrophosphate-binding protein [Deltaproteobacteria bacterium]MBI2998412.1 thiamine pyrophosphate-binding protein [Deltaproteobacteria bacterium]